MAEKRILLGVTGSVAAILTGKMVTALLEVGEVRIVITDKGHYFTNHIQIEGADAIYYEQDEWWRIISYPSAIIPPRTKKWKQKDDPIEHIELRDWADCLVIAPLTANTLAKIVHGLCDNFLTSIVRAWDHQKPMILAPAMNTKMWWNKPTPEQVYELRERGIIVIDPVEKKLACGETGMGAMAPIDVIVDAVRSATFRVVA